MDKVSKEERLKNIVCKGLEHLHDKLEYGQINVLGKLDTLGHTVSASSLSNIKKGRPVGLPTLSLAAKGMQTLLRQELDMAFDAEEQDFQAQHTPGWTATIALEKSAQQAVGPGFVLHVDGRVSLQQKTDFTDQAKQEVIEVGVRLNSFSGYFIHQNEGAYKTHIVALLQKGVHVKGYLLDPDSNEARIYFDDRAKVQSSEKDSISEIKKVIERLRKLCGEFEEMQWPGKFEIYLYKHIPYNLFLVVDGATDNGKMMVSPYLYGVSRANCPVLEFTQAGKPHLYGTYWKSMQSFLEGARKLT